MKKSNPTKYQQSLSREELFNIGKKYMTDNQKLLDKYGIKTELVIHFPTKKKLPFLSKIALKIIRNQGGILDTRFMISEKKGRGSGVRKSKK